MRILFPLLFLGLPFHGCQTVIAPPPANVASAPILGKAVGDKDSKISAHAEAAEIAIMAGPEGGPKEAAKGAISVVRSLAGPATQEDRLAALNLVNKALSGKLTEAQKGWDEAKDNAEKSKSQIAALQAQVDRERTQAAADLQARLKEAHDEARKSRDRIITIIFMGGGALFMVLGIICLVMVSNPATAASYAFLGPKAGFCAIGAGILLIGSGIAVNAIENAIDRHPNIILAGVLSALACAGVGITLIYANHKNHTDGK